MNNEKTNLLTLHLFIINMLTGISYSFILPVMGTYLITYLHFEPRFLAIYSFGFALSGMFFSQFLCKLSDNQYNTKFLFLLSLASIACSSLLFCFVKSKTLVFLTGFLVMGLGHSSIPLILAMIRMHADTLGLNSAYLNSKMRSGVSFIWILGPSLAFTISSIYSFKLNFILTFSFSICSFLYSMIVLPDFKNQVHSDSAQKNNINTPMIQQLLLGFIITLPNLANNLYITSIPLYITTELHLPAFFPGIILGLTSLLEIPIMLLASRFYNEKNKFYILSLGLVVGGIYYSLLQAGTSTYYLLSIQIFNAIFFGIFVGIGITIVQDFYPNKKGFSSAFYSNSMRIGMMFGCSLSGIIAQVSSFKISLYGSLISVLMAFILVMILITKEYKYRSERMV